MDSLFRTPFLDIFKQGGVDRDIRMMVAQGALGLRAEELRLTLEFLAADPDPEISRTAEATLLAVRAGDAAAAQPYVAPEPDPEPEPEEALTPDEKEKKKQGTLQKIAALNPAQRLALAMKGTREERAVLIRDPNKIVAVAVLSSPKISESEVANIAKMANVSEEILRIIGNTRAWMKSYTVTCSLVKNPKTPIAVSMNLLQRLTEKDLKMLTTDRNISDVVRTAARKKIAPVH
jgi:hypothetical protein